MLSPCYIVHPTQNKLHYQMTRPKNDPNQNLWYQRDLITNPVYKCLHNYIPEISNFGDIMVLV